jgi:hypothetical protein
MTHLIPTKEGYIVVRGFNPQFVVERCPEEHKATHGNVIALCPVRPSREMGIDELIVAAILNRAMELRDGKA